MTDELENNDKLAVDNTKADKVTGASSESTQIDEAKASGTATAETGKTAATELGKMASGATVDETKTGNETDEKNSETVNQKLKDESQTTGEADGGDDGDDNGGDGDNGGNGGNGGNGNDDPSSQTTKTEEKQFVWTPCMVYLSVYLLVLMGGLFLGIWYTLPGCVVKPASANTNTNNNQTPNTNNNQTSNRSNTNTGNTNTGNANTGNANTGNVNTGNTNAGNAANPDTGGTQSPAAPAAPTPAPTPPPVKILSISPKAGEYKSNTLVTIKGSGFGKEPKVLFGGIQLEDFLVPPSDESITVRTNPHSAETVDVAVVAADGRSDVQAGAYTYSCPPTESNNLLLLVLLAGALGGTIHSMRSLWWYVGNREFVESWLLMYIFLPFIGAAIAAIFYWVFYGGLFQGSSTNAPASSYLIAVAALVGLFSQQALLKLRDIANAIFTKPGEGKDAVEQASESVGADAKNKGMIPRLEKLTPDKGKISGQTEVKITGIPKIDHVFVGNQEVIATPAGTNTFKFKTPPHDKEEEVMVTILGGKKPVLLPFTYTDKP
ncbi:MAG TPA: IPT/TIG domain-containing protein [Pyrinomonadaceae bacterium]|jgi:hypothetical protein